jgi:hypothetical protein
MHTRTHCLTSAPHAYTTCTHSRRYPHTDTRAARRRTLLDETAREGTCCSTDCGIARAHDSCLCRACQIHTHCHRTATCCTAASITCTSWILVASLCGLSFCAITSALGCGCRAFRRRCEWMGAKLAPEACPLWLSCAVCIVRSIGGTSCTVAVCRFGSQSSVSVECQINRLALARTISPLGQLQRHR